MFTVMRELLLFAASLAGAVIMSTMAVLVRPESPLWRVALWIAIGVFLSCAILILVDYLRPGESKISLLGFGVGLTLTIGFGLALYFEPITSHADIQRSYGLGNKSLHIELGTDQNYERSEHLENGLLRRSIYIAVCNDGDEDIHDCNVTPNSRDATIKDGRYGIVISHIFPR
jgi:hypothetical protein